MADLRVFVSSTCYDLSLLRSQFRIFVKNIGFEPVMSDYEDVLYDPRIHTHTSCIDEVANCDMLVMLIGSRFGGKTSSEALARINFDELRSDCPNIDLLKQSGSFSISHLEFLKAAECSMPVYVFIEKRVWHEHALYEKNKSTGIIDQIQFPSIEKQETAKYVFEFINLVRHRTKGNSVFTFDKWQDIEDVLRKQWSSYFQRLLNEQRYSDIERKKIDMLSEKFDDLKIAILSSINDVDQREIARSVIRYRHVFDLLSSFRIFNREYFESTQDRWDDVLKKAAVREIRDVNGFNGNRLPRLLLKSLLIREDSKYYECKWSKDMIEEAGEDWDKYISMNSHSRKIVTDAILETQRPFSILKFVDDVFCDTETLESQA